MTPADSLAVLTTLFGVVVTIMVFVLAIVTWLIFQDEPRSSSSSQPSGATVAESATNANATGVAVIVVLLLAGALAAGQIIHWAWS